MRISWTISLLSCLATASAGPAAEPGPRLVAAWPSGLMEVRLAFDRPVDPSVATAIVGVPIGFGDPTRPAEERGSLAIAAARLADDGRTLVLVTDPHPREAVYTLSIPGVKAVGEAGQGARVDLTYDLSGVEASWAANGAKPTWSGWWPGLDPASTREGLKGSADHDRLWPMLNQPGTLTLRTLVALPAGAATITVDADAPFEATLGAESARSIEAATATHRAALRAESTGEAIELSLALSTGGKGFPRLRVALISAKDPAPRPLARGSLVLPWAPAGPPMPAPPSAPADLLAGGDPASGEAVFHGEKAKCATCHAVRGKGGAIGPDLTNLVGRDRAWVYRNIIEPSASIHPNYASYTVALKDGRIVVGTVKAKGADAIQVGDIEAKQSVIARADVEEIRPAVSSVMPVGLLSDLGDEKTRDLLAFLTARPGAAR